MIQIDDRSFPEIRKEFILKRAELINLKEKRATRRASISEEERERLDKSFLDTFNEITSEKSTDYHVLKDLLEKGASTACFDAHELSGGNNFAQALKDWIPAASFTHEHQAIAHALDICIEAGDAFLSNKYYVGNGGAYSIYLLIEYIVGSWVYISQAPKKKNSEDEFAYHLYIKMALLAGDHLKFWEEFYLGQQLLLTKTSGSENKLQHSIARFGLHCLVYEKPAFIQHYFTQDLSYNPELVDMCRAFFSAPVLLEELLKNADSAQGIFGDAAIKKNMNEVLAQKWPKIYGTFLSSSISRKKIKDLLKSSAWLRNQFLSHPASLFKLLKEKDIILPLLQKERKQLLNLRNAEGDTLLIALCKAQGKTENMVQLYVKYGFDPKDVNQKGESAISIAQRRKKDTLLLALES